MSARIVSAEEARSRFLAAESDVRGVLDYYVTVRDALATVPDDIRERLAGALAELVVGSVDAERDAALARVARLERVLAVERGDASQAPPNWWRRNPGHWSGGSAKHAVRDADGLWWWGPDDPKTCPLDAMEAADAATSTPTPPAATTAPPRSTP